MTSLRTPFWCTTGIKLFNVSECLVTSDSLWPHGLYSPPCSMEFSRQEYWSRFPFPTPEDLKLFKLKVNTKISTLSPPPIKKNKKFLRSPCLPREFPRTTHLSPVFSLLPCLSLSLLHAIHKVPPYILLISCAGQFSQSLYFTVSFLTMPSKLKWSVWSYLNSNRSLPKRNSAARLKIISFYSVSNKWYKFPPTYKFNQWLVLNLARH